MSRIIGLSFLLNIFQRWLHNADRNLAVEVAENQKITTIRNSRSGEGERAIEIWRRAVDATHHFLAPEDRSFIDTLDLAGMPVADLPNLGPKSQQMLELAGIATLDQLRALGSVAAFARVKQSGGNPSLNLLWALEGALTGLRWQDVAKEHRTSLLLALEQHEREA